MYRVEAWAVPALVDMIARAGSASQGTRDLLQDVARRGCPGFDAGDPPEHVTLARRLTFGDRVPNGRLRFDPPEGYSPVYDEADPLAEMEAAETEVAREFEAGLTTERRARRYTREPR